MELGKHERGHRRRHHRRQGMRHAHPGHASLTLGVRPRRRRHHAVLAHLPRQRVAPLAVLPRRRRPPQAPVQAGRRRLGVLHRRMAVRFELIRTTDWKTSRCQVANTHRNLSCPFLHYDE